jgi:dienelactone hydrolase
MKIFRLLSCAALLTTPLPMPAWSQEAPKQPTAPGSGPYPATYVTWPGLPDHVVYLPHDLSVVGEKGLGIYVFGNGGCSADGTSARNHLLDIASHGYIAIAPGVIPGPNRQPPAPRQLANGRLSADTPAESLPQAIDWAVAENARSGSPLAGLVATDQVAISGWSCGGLQALNNAADPRVRTTIIMNSGIFNNEGDGIEGLPARKATLQAVHGPILYVLGGPDDMAQPNGLDDYRRIDHVPAAVVDIPVGHGGTFDQENGGTGAEVVAAWLDWTLKGDDTAGQKFRGADCGYCNDSRFSLDRKNID